MLCQRKFPSLRGLWRDLVALGRAQATPAAPQPALFTLREDHRPAGERDAVREPSLFTMLERSRLHGAQARARRRHHGADRQPQLSGDRDYRLFGGRLRTKVH
jgi:hypothetical protein